MIFFTVITRNAKHKYFYVWFKCSGGRYRSIDLFSRLSLYKDFLVLHQSLFYAVRSSILLRMEKREGPYFLCRLRTSRQVLGKHGRWTLRRSEGIYYAECGLPLRDVAGLNKLSSPASFKLIRSTDLSAHPSDAEMFIGFLSFINFHWESLEIHDQEKHL